MDLTTWLAVLAAAIPMLLAIIPRLGGGTMLMASGPAVAPRRG